MTAPQQRPSVSHALGEDRERIRIIERTLQDAPLPACRAYVRVDTATIPTDTVYSPPYWLDGVYKSSDGPDGIWTTRGFPFTGTYYNADDTGSGGTGSVINVQGPGLFLARGDWTFGFDQDTIAGDFNAQMTIAGEFVGTVDADGSDGPIMLDGFAAGADYGGNAGDIDPRGWATDQKIVFAYPGGTTAWMGGLPRVQLRCETIFGLREGSGFAQSLYTRVLHTYGSDLPFVSYMVLSVTRLGNFI